MITHSDYYWLECNYLMKSMFPDADLDPLLRLFGRIYRYSIFLALCFLFYKFYFWTLAFLAIFCTWISYHIGRKMQCLHFCFLSFSGTFSLVYLCSHCLMAFSILNRLYLDISRNSSQCWLIHWFAFFLFLIIFSILNIIRVCE